MTIDDVLQGEHISSLSKNEQSLLFKLAMDDETVLLLGRAQQQGIDVKGLFKSMVKE